VAVFFVMAIRPLADIFSRTNLVRPLVILRKGVGVFSAAIIISFIFSKIIMDPTGYVYAFGTVKYWSLQNFALLAHIADVSAILLLLTSNNLSKKIFGSWWKKIQKLSYPYFYASALYVFLITGHNSMLVSMFTITALTMIAYIKNKNRFQQQTI
jgi:DMSO/TMAO reductase YedYZ heme-binding membrane subunit